MSKYRRTKSEQLNRVRGLAPQLTQMLATDLGVGVSNLRTHKLNSHQLWWELTSGWKFFCRLHEYTDYEHDNFTIRVHDDRGQYSREYREFVQGYWNGMLSCWTDPSDQVIEERMLVRLDWLIYYLNSGRVICPNLSTNPAPDRSTYLRFFLDDMPPEVVLYQARTET